MILPSLRLAQPMARLAITKCIASMLAPCCIAVGTTPVVVQCLVPVWCEAGLMACHVGPQRLVAPEGTGGTQQQLLLDGRLANLGGDEDAGRECVQATCEACVQKGDGGGGGDSTSADI